jgi:hypothetical protein
MNGNGNGNKDEFSALDAIDLATMKEDKVCIQRDHATGQLAWRFASPQADPMGLMLRCMVYDLIINSDLARKVKELEARLAQLEAERG